MASAIRKIFTMILQNAEALRVTEMARIGNRGAYWTVDRCKLPKWDKIDNFSEKTFQKGLK